MITAIASPFRSCFRMTCRLAVQVLIVVFALQAFPCAPAHASEKWSGVDESVVEKYAREHGREAREPLINTDQGDLLLFVFLLAGAVAGFAGGYFWRMLIERKPACAESSREGKRLET